jgi:ribonuclease Z
MSLRVTFLGTSGAVPTTGRNTSAIAVRREGDAFLWDCGEGTQRQMMRFGTGFDLDGIFVTHAHGDHTLGLPGLLQTLDFNERERGLTIHVPGGTRRQIRSVIDAGGTDPSFPVRIDEVTDGSVAHRGDDYEIRAFATDHDTHSVGYALAEDDRKGRFDRETAEEELGISPGPAYSRLHDGESVELDDGRVIHPDQVVGDPRPGRTVVYTGDTRATDRTVSVAEDADLLVHDATFADDLAARATKTAHTTAREAGEIASRAGVVRLALTHLSTRYAGDVSAHEREASEAFDGEAFVPDDGRVVEVPFRDA